MEANIPRTTVCSLPPGDPHAIIELATVEVWRKGVVIRYAFQKRVWCT